jgi:ribosomal protein S18 acetylase RimI-like enzyme
MRFRIFHQQKSKFLDRVVIRHLAKKDLRALEWEGEFTHFRRLYGESYKRMLRGDTIMWVAELPDSGIIGQVFIQLNCGRPELANGIDRAYLYSFRIRPSFRNLGLGSLILKTIEEDLLERSYKSITLNVAKDNLRARHLYERHGYKVVDHEPGVWSYIDHEGFWRHVNEPAWRMLKEINQ